MGQLDAHASAEEVRAFSTETGTPSSRACSRARRRRASAKSWPGFSAPVGIEIGPGEAAHSLHRDEGVYPVAHPHDELVTNVMWALDDFTQANGATRVARVESRRTQRKCGAQLRPRASRSCGLVLKAANHLGIESAYPRAKKAPCTSP